ncbi:MAG: tetratricopeptide repeat protein [Candidatus Zixiibacteriota bacterium]|nr:MAG: tetratricopeptide repeat protein [candidate division Zixibacteria bacterium]
MESFCLNSRIVENEKEFLIQTANDVKEGVIRATLFVDGELLDASVLPHSEDITEDEILNLVKTAHGDKKSELEYLLKSYKEIIEKGRSEEMYHLGTALFCKRMYPEARELFRCAIKLKHDYHEAHFYLSQTELAMNNIEEAVKAAGKSVELKPEYADYRNNLGEAYLESESCKRAVIEFEEAIKKNVYYADAYFNLALAYIVNAVKKEDFGMYSDLTARCMDLLEKAVLINPDYHSTTYNEAFSALSSGDLTRAYKLFRSVRVEKNERQRQEKAAYFHRFLIYTDWLSEHNIADRIALLERRLNKNPDYADLYFELGNCYLHQAKFGWQKGMEYLKKALSINNKLRKAQRALELSEEHYLKLTDAISDISEKEV